MTGGSSGGPWLLNLGVDAAASNGATYGSVALRVWRGGARKARRCRPQNSHKTFLTDS